MNKINDFIDNSPVVYWFMSVGSVMLGGTTFYGKNFASTAFFILASIVFLPPIQRNISTALRQQIQPKLFMHAGITFIIVAMIIFMQFNK